MIINVLGTEYTVEDCEAADDKYLEKYDGYCDKTSKRIVVVKPRVDDELDDFEVYRKKVLRHEIIHAFLYESGLHENFEHPKYGHDETTIDWIAVQFPKMVKVFEQAGCL